MTYHPDYHFMYRPADDVHPPQELIRHWTEFYNNTKEKPPEWWVVQHVALRAAEWGADQELEMCATYLDSTPANKTAEDLIVARRSKTPSLKEQALTALHAVATGTNDYRKRHQDFDAIRIALKALPDA